MPPRRQRRGGMLEVSSVVVDATAVFAGDVDDENRKHRADANLGPVHVGDQVTDKGDAIETLG